MQFIKVLEDFMINKKICVHINYDLNLKKVKSREICEGMLSNLNTIIKEYSLNSDDMIFMLDYSRVSLDMIPITKIKKIVQFMTQNTQDILYKCIIYNSTKTLKPIIKIIKTFMDPITAKKIVIDDTVDSIIKTALSNKQVLNNISESINAEVPVLNNS